MKLTDSKDPAVNPGHYQTPEGIESIDVIDIVLERASKTGILDDANYAATGDLFNIIKYLLRYKDKNGVQDLRKALWYCEDSTLLTHPKHNDGDIIDAFSNKIEDPKEAKLFILALTAVLSAGMYQSNMDNDKRLRCYMKDVSKRIKDLIDYLEPPVTWNLEPKASDDANESPEWGKPDPKYVICAEIGDPALTTLTNYIFTNELGDTIFAQYRPSEGVLGESSGTIKTYDTSHRCWHALYPGNDLMKDRFRNIIETFNTPQ